jgi:diguanylate cyclase (GGDEF)-like protein/PAS domain S-box-containing protein
MVADERNVRNRAITAYLAMGATAIVAYFLLPDGAGSVVWDVIALSVPATIVIGVRRFRPSRRLPWQLIAAGFGLWACGDIFWSFPTAGAIGPGDVAYTIGYPAMALGCLMMARTDRRTSMLAMVDALIGAFGLAVIVWDVVLSNGVQGRGPSFASLVGAAYPVLDVLVLTLLIRLALAERSQPPAYWWLVGGFAVVMAADLSYAWLQRVTAEPSGALLDLGWLVGYVAVGAAALHPSMAHLTRRGAPDAMLSPGRVLWLGTPLFAVPILMLFSGRDQPVDLVIQGSASIAIAALILVRIVMSARDQDRAHRVARTAELEYRAVFEGSPVAVLKVREGGEILDANPAAEQLLEYEGGLRGRAIRGLLVDPAVDGPQIRMSVTALIDGPSGAHATWTMRVLRGDGSSFWSSMNTSIVKDRDGAVSYGITTVEDITRKREDEERLRFRALHDPLTGLPNRDLLDESLRRALARARRAGTRVAVLFLDLDGFKDVNDRMGHAVGDELLRALAQRLESSSRGGDMVARLGGDEFVIVVEDVRNDQQAEASAARFLNEVRRSVVLGGARISLDASIGLVVTGAADVDPDEILRRADSAMYEAKRSGLGGWRRFGAETAAGLGA